MMHIMLLYGRMLGCYSGPVPSADALPQLVPDTLPNMPKGTFGAEAAGEEDPFVAAATAAGDESMAIKPWKGAVKAVTPKDKSFDPRPPGRNLVLDWVYGYQAQISRNNLRYNSQGGIIYPAAALGVIYDQGKHAQDFFKGHDDDVICLAVSSCKTFAVTGQMGKKPKAMVWDANTGQEIAILSGKHQREITSVAISADGKQIAMVGKDDSHSISVWTASGDGPNRWKKKKKGGVGCNFTKGNKSVTLFIAFTGGAKHPVCTGGVKFVDFYTKENKKSKGIGGKGGKTNQPFICAAGHKGNVFTGAASGEIFVWSSDSRKIVAGAMGHGKKSCDAIHVNANGHIVSGGKDGRVVVWGFSGKSLEQVGAYELTKATPAPIKPCIRSVCWDVKKKSILIGTLGSEIYELQNVGSDGASVGRAKSKCYLQSHFSNELWAVATHPTKSSVFASAGDDKTVRMWDMNTHKMTSYATTDDLARAVAFSPDGKTLAVGQGGRLGGTRRRRKGKSKSGGAVVFNLPLSDGAKGTKLDQSKEWVQTVSFSPDGSKLAVGSHDNRTYIYDTGKYSGRPRVCKKGSSFVVNLDWSKSGKSLQTTDGAHELLFYDANAKQNYGGIKHQDLASASCELGWHCQGIWPPSADGTDVNHCARNDSSTLLATGDDFGKVKLFRYPCVKEGSGFKMGRGHASHVTSVAFTRDEKFLVSTGGNDRCILQWKIE